MTKRLFDRNGRSRWLSPGRSLLGRFLQSTNPDTGKRWTEEDAGFRCGVSGATISALATGITRHPSLALAYALREAPFGIDPITWLMDPDEDDAEEHHLERRIIRRRTNSNSFVRPRGTSGLRAKTAHPRT